MTARSRSLIRAAAVAALTGLAVGCAGHPQTTFEPVTEYGRLLNHLFENTFWWTMFVLAVVWGALVVIVLRFREKEGAPRPEPVHGNAKLEIAWTIGPAIIVAFIAVPTIHGIFETQAPAPANALTVEVIGHQWWWEFRYPEYGVVTANELRIPTGRPIDLTMHSADVIHSFWIPRLGGKRDVNPQPALPGTGAKRVNHIVFTADSTGVFLGQCAEFCGTAHADMRVRAVVETPADFQTWVAAMKTPEHPPPNDTLAVQGEKIFGTKLCVACHTLEGTPAAGLIGPNLTRLGSRETIGAGMLPMSQQNLVKWITHPAAVKPGANMPGIKVGGGGMPPTGLTQHEVEAIAAYLASLK